MRAAVHSSLLARSRDHSASCTLPSRREISRSLQDDHQLPGQRRLEPGTDDMLPKSKGETTRLSYLFLKRFKWKKNINDIFIAIIITLQYYILRIWKY